MTRDRFHVIDGGRSDDDPPQQDDEDALAALAEVIAGPEGTSDPDVADRALQLASDIMSGRDAVNRERPGEGGPAPWIE